LAALLLRHDFYITDQHLLIGNTSDAFIKTKKFHNGETNLLMCLQKAMKSRAKNCMAIVPAADGDDG
jgi:hypothetical protein